MKKILLLFIPAILFYSCKSDSPVSPNTGNTPGNYSKLYSYESNGTKFELWSASGQSLYIGYNDIGFKVYINGNEQKSGFVKFHPMMFHSLNGPVHSSPVSDVFNFSNDKNLFTGYACFIMLSDSGSHWYCNLNYNDVSQADTVPFNVLNLSSNQLKYWDDIYGGHTYILSLIKPLSPILGANTFTCILHRTNDDIHYIEVDSAQMFIRPWMAAHGHGSSNNQDPIGLGGGLYEGKAMFTMPGDWVVYDSIKINGSFITHNPPPQFSFPVQ